MTPESCAEGTQVALDFEDLKERVAQRAPRPCTACGGMHFDMQPEAVLLPYAEPDGAGFRLLDGGCPCAALVCTKCGFVRLHAVRTLRRMDLSV